MRLCRFVAPQAQVALATFLSASAQAPNTTTAAHDDADAQRALAEKERRSLLQKTIAFVRRLQLHTGAAGTHKQLSAALERAFDRLLLGSGAVGSDGQAHTPRALLAEWQKACDAKIAELTAREQVLLSVLSASLSLSLYFIHSVCLFAGPSVAAESARAETERNYRKRQEPRSSSTRAKADGNREQNTSTEAGNKHN